MTTTMRDDVAYLVPSRTMVEELKVGDLALDCWGRMAEVVEISYRGIDVKGKAFVGYYTKSSETSRISASMKEGEIVRHAGLSRYHKSAEIDQIERALAVRS